MPNISTSFAGQIISTPGAYYNDTLTPVPANFNPEETLIFVGNGYGSAYATPVPVQGSQNLSALLRGSPASQFIPFFANPSPQLNGTSSFIFINAASHTSATANLTNSTENVITLTSAFPGPTGNTQTYTVTAGTVGGINLTLADPVYTGLVYSANNLGVPFTLSYTGTVTSLTYSVIQNSSGQAITFQTSGAPAGSPANVTIDLTSSAFSTISQVVSYLNSTGEFSAFTVSNASLPTSNLDAVASAALAPNTAVNVTATLGDIVYWVNNVASSIATASALVTSDLAAKPIPAGPSNFTGGAAVAPTSSNYATALNAALNVSGGVIFIDSSQSSIQLLGAQHVQTASTSQYNAYREYFTGSTVGDSISTTITNIQNVGAKNVIYAYPGIIIRNTTGQNTTYGGLANAAMAASIRAGNPAPTPLTNKTLSGVGPEVNLTVSQIQQLQQAGCMVIGTSSINGLPYIIDDLTTYSTDSNPENIFEQQIAIRYTLAYEIISLFTPYVGTVASTGTISAATRALIKYLNSEIYNPNTNPTGILNSWAATNPDGSSAIVTSYNANTQSLSITVPVVPVGQFRNIFFTAQITPFGVNTSIS